MSLDTLKTLKMDYSKTLRAIKHTRFIQRNGEFANKRFYCPFMCFSFLPDFISRVFTPSLSSLTLLVAQIGTNKGLVQKCFKIDWALIKGSLSFMGISRLYTVKGLMG